MRRERSAQAGFQRLGSKATAAALAGLLLLADAALAGGGYEMRSFVIGGGGGHGEAGDYVLDGTVGQPVTGLVEAAPYELSSGFWCGCSSYEAFLPLVLRAAP